MASSVTDTLVSKKLQIMLNNGVTDSGAAKSKTKTFTNVNPEATDANLKKAADALATLFDNTVMGIYHVDKSILETVEDND
ncbi:MAG: DUF1659 domain-containing protein [Acidaminococcaceae bacterium]|nr:DUF1659 domain-containing protein [Acidaminococcaceae bacterium]